MLISCPPFIYNLSSKLRAPVRSFADQMQGMCIAALKPHLLEHGAWRGGVATNASLAFHKNGSLKSARLSLGMTNVPQLPFDGEVLVPCEWSVFDEEHEHLRGIIATITSAWIDREVAHRHRPNCTYRELIGMGGEQLDQLKQRGEKYGSGIYSDVDDWCDVFAGRLAAAELEARKGESNHERISQIQRQQAKHCAVQEAIENELAEATRLSNSDPHKLGYVWNEDKRFARDDDELLLLRYRIAQFRGHLRISS